MAQTVKNLPAVQETWVPSLGQEDPLQKEMATHFSILAWRTPWTEEPGGLQSMELQRVVECKATEFSVFSLSFSHFHLQPSSFIRKTHVRGSLLRKQSV